MFTIGTRPNSSAWSTEHRADARQVAAVADHDQVVVDVRLGIRRKRSMCGMKSYIGGTGSLHTGVARPPSASTSSATAERRAERIRVRVLVADGQDPACGADASATTSRARRERPPASARWCHALRRAGRVVAARGAPVAPVRRGRRWPASAGSPRGAARPLSPPCLEIVEDLQHASAALGRVVLLDVQLRDALQAQLAQAVADEGHGVARARSVCLRSSAGR